MIEERQHIPQSDPTKLSGNKSTFTFKKLAMKGAVWSTLGYGFKQIPRFLNRLILAKLLFPELFGIMAIVDTFILGLIFFSDIGINPSIIQNKKGDTPAFLNTAWTIQVGRGLLLWLLSFFAAPFVAQYYEEPILAVAVPIAGISAIFAGFKSTKFAVANRQLQMREITLIEVGAYLAGIMVTIVWAWLRPSIWALVAGNLVTTFLDAAFSHLFLKGQNNRLAWNGEAAKAIFNFGRWIFFSTALTFLANQSDRLIIGKLINVAFLGIFSNALMFAKMVEQGIATLGYRVLFPSYAELARQKSDDLYKTLKQSRIAFAIISGLGGLFFILFGELFINLLFDDRWQEAGWMLRFLGFGTLVSGLGFTYDSVLIAIGKTFQVATIMAVQFVVLVFVLYVGNQIGGEQGVVLGLATVPWLTYPLRAFWAKQEKIWQPEVDLPYLAISAVVVLLSFFYLY